MLVFRVEQILHFLIKKKRGFVKIAFILVFFQKWKN